MKRKGTNIITDQDIDLTAYENQNKTLSEVLTEQKQEIDQLKSNVKFIYKYGGIGSGSSGGGGGSGTSWKVVVTRTETGSVITSGTNINLSGPGNYGFTVQVYGGGTSSFKITYNWINSKGTQTRNSIVSVNEGFNSKQTLLLDQNGTLSITILNQDTQEPIVYSIPYITTSYIFDLYYVNKRTKERFNPPNNTIFMSTVKKDGLMVAFSYSLAVDVLEATYKYVNWDPELTEPIVVPFDDTSIPQEQRIEGNTSKIIYLDLHPDIYDFLSHNENAKYIQFSLDIDLMLAGNTSKENIDTFYLRDNLIPSDIYLKISTSAGALYDGKQSSYPESSKFSIGPAIFQLTPYYGQLDTTRTYQLDIRINGEGPVNDIRLLSDQTTQAVAIPITSDGEKELKFTISLGSVSYTKTYFICVKELTSSFNWYPENATAVKSAYYRRYIGSSNILDLDGTILNKDKTISMTVNSNERTYRFTDESLPSYVDYDQLLSIGFQYSEINDTNMPIASFNTQNTGIDTLFIYQSKIVLSLSDTNIPPNINGDEREIFFPMTSNLSDSSENASNYHILSIYKRFEYIDDNQNYQKAIYIYLDGVLEGVFGSMTTRHKKYESITFYPGNYYVNLIESSCFSHGYSTSTSSSITWLEDNDLVGYFYSYKEKLLGQGEDITENEKRLYDSFKTFTYDKQNYIRTDDTAIANIAKYSSIPTIVINYTDNSGSIGSISGWGKDNFKEWMEQTHEENDFIETLPVTIQWAKGDQTELSQPLTNPKNAQELAYFGITMQGSSTLGYRCKNWELIAPESKDENKTFIYSPNFVPVSDTMSDEAKKEAYKSFLPEESFTLKADVVDSSHSNNNAMGSFINAVTTHFDKAQQASSTNPYGNYIKNCLIGFPVLVFLHTRFKSPGAQTADNNNYYFLGIYNFNLGRKSYFNLGYKDTSKLNSLHLENGFKIYEIDNNNNTLLTKIRVGEIQGNNDYFDFSQYHESILYPLENNDKTYMFGDFVDGTGSSNIAVKTDIQNFVRKVALGGGYVFKEVGKQFSEEEGEHYGYTEGYSAVDGSGIPKNQVPNYRHQAIRSRSGGDLVYNYTTINEATEQDLAGLILKTDEYPNPALDYTSLCEYYTTCMAFGLVDSVQKNLNIKSWDNGQYFYVTFYDMDTCLGVSNAGSRINYFAFSDYWQSDIDENNRLSSVKVYRDFSPIDTGNTTLNGESTSSFFDVPSSYLFAVAKYAHLILNDESLIMHPSNIWALWRNKNTSALNPQVGCLSSADYFMENYYSHHLDNAPLSAFNFNYRYKYLVTDNSNPSKFDNVNFAKFYGRKLAYTRDWLNGRLHILDAYFNLNGISDQLTDKYIAPVANNDYIDRSNSDIYVLKDIFSSESNGNQYSNLNYDVVVKARPYAPLIVKVANRANRYMFPSTPQNCTINLASSGTQFVLFGGSSLWTELSTINPFITLSNTLTVNSAYFTKLTGNRGTCSSWTLNTPSLKSISLTDNSYYTGTLSFNSSGATQKFPNLQEVIIDGTGLQLDVNNASLTKISALNMKGSSSISVTNVDTLTSFAASGTMSNLTIYSWKNGIVFPTTYSSSNPSARLDCSNMYIINDPVKYPHNTLRIYNNDTLSHLTFTGFEEVYVENCPRLNWVDIGDSETKYLKKLSIVMPNSSTISNPPTTFKLNSSSEDNVVDLSEQSSLETVILKRCLMETVKLPNKEVILETEAFRYCSNLKYLHGTGSYLMKGVYIFADCPEFTMKQSENGSFSNLIVPNTTTAIDGEFYISDINKKGHVDKSAAINFLDNCCINASNVESISRLFENQNISYTKEDFIYEYRRNTSSLKLSNFPKCSNISRVFYNNPIDAYNRYMFTNLGKNISDISFIEVIGESIANSDPNRAYEIYNSMYHVVYTTVDFLAEIIDKISSMALRTYNIDVLYYYFLDIKNDSYSMLEEVKLKDIFNPNIGTEEEPNLKYPSRLSYFTQFEIFPQHTINFKNWFNSNWRSIEISTVFYYSNYPNITPGSLDGLLKPLTLTSITTFLSSISNYENDTNGRVDMAEFINWNNINQVTNLFLSTAGYKSLGFNKYVDYSDFHNIWDKILKSSRLTSVASLFENCLIVGQTYGNCFTLTDNNYTGGINNRITALGWLFRNCRMSDSLDSENYEYWNISHDFLKYLPKLTWVGYMFDNTLWKHTIPFDFFNKRKESISKVYVLDNNEKKLANRHYFSYSREITTFSRCFADIRLESSDAFNPDADYNCGTVKGNYIKLLDNEGHEIEGTSYDIFYETNSPTATPIVLEQPTEIQDIEFAKELKENGDISYTRSTRLKFGNTVTNYALSDYQGLFVAPDVFYGSSISVGYITSCFDASGISTDYNVFTGIIPNNFLINVKNWQPSSVLASLNILPFKFSEYIEDNNVIKSYRFVPKNYTGSQNLDYAFNFRLFIPETKLVDQNTTEIRYFILLSDSIPSNASSLIYAFPNSYSTSKIFGQEAGWPSYYVSDSGIRFNIMGTPVTAPRFNQSADYDTGSYIIYNNNSYRFKVYHSHGSLLTPSHVNLINTDEFDTETEYQQGDYVKYNNNFYVFNEAYTGDWDETKVTLIEASEFDIASDYSIGNYVIYNDKLYIFNQNHQAEVDLVDLPGNYNNVLFGLNLSIFNNLYLDYIFNPDIMAITYGDLFTDRNLNWSKNKLRDGVNNYCVVAGYGNSGYGGISYNVSVNLPVLNNNFLTLGGECWINRYSIKNENEVDFDKYPSLERYPVET